ncbi:MAG: hypothetical protein NVSMB58_26640 [Terriglobales bacterium]
MKCPLENPVEYLCQWRRFPYGVFARRAESITYGEWVADSKRPARNRAGRPCPLEIVASQLASHIHDFPDEK